LSTTNDTQARAGTSVLDRLLDAHPDQAQDRPRSAAQTVTLLRAAVHRDVEYLLNARRPWRSVRDPALRKSPLGYGISDFTAGAFNDRREREVLRSEIEETIRRFEPRLARLEVEVVEDASPLRATLTLRIKALLLVEPLPEPISFDTLVDTTTADVALRPVQDIGS
jgi:type VI secretion system protein ImpF